MKIKNTGVPLSIGHLKKYKNLDMYKMHKKIFLKKYLDFDNYLFKNVHTI